MWPLGSYSPRDLSTAGLESGGTTLAAPTLASTPTLAGTPVPLEMMPPPTDVTYQPSFEPFTTDRE
jgi:hypothetical protein